MKTQQNETKTILNSTVKKRAVLYARTSGDDTARDSLSAQLETCEEYTTEQNYVIVERLSEDVRGVSGADFNAPELVKAVTMAQAGLFDVLVIRDVKRYSRDVYKAMSFERDFFNVGIEIEYVWNRELNGLPQDGVGRMMRFVQYWQSEEDRKSIVQTLYNGRVNNSVRNKGRVLVHGNPPYGYRSVDYQLVIDDKEAYWVRQIFEWYAKGLSLRGIARKLKENSVATASESPNRISSTRKKLGRCEWRITSIAQILKNRVYIGKWTYAKKNNRAGKIAQRSIIKDFLEKNSNATLEVPALVDVELFDAAQTRLAENRKRLRRKPKGDYLLRRRCTCGLCDYKMVCITRKRPLKNGHGYYSYYLCSWKNTNTVVPGTDHKCTLPQFKRDIVDKKVWEWLKKKMENESELLKGFEDYKAGQQKFNEPLLQRLEQIDREEKDLRRDLARQTAAYVELVGNERARAGIKADIGQIEKTLDKLDGKRQVITAKIRQVKIDEKRIRDALTFAREIRAGIAKADHRFSKRREIIEALNVTVTLTVEDGKRYICPEFVFSKEKEQFSYNDMIMV